MQHHILGKFKAEITFNEKIKLINRMEELFLNVKEIEGIHDVKVYRNVVDRSNRMDYMVVVTMEPSSLEIYDDCKWHHQVKLEMDHLLEKKAVFDTNY